MMQTVCDLVGVCEKLADFLLLAIKPTRPKLDRWSLTCEALLKRKEKAQGM